MRIASSTAGGPNGNTAFCTRDDRADLCWARAYTEENQKKPGPVEEIRRLSYRLLATIQTRVTSSLS
jgi:hypothetical protein